MKASWGRKGRGRDSEEGGGKVEARQRKEDARRAVEARSILLAVLCLSSGEIERKS